MCLLAFLRGNGTVFPRRRLQFFFCAEKDTLFWRGRVPLGVLGGFGGSFRRRTSYAGNLRVLGGKFPRRRLHFSVPGGFGGSFPRGQQKKLTQKVSFALYFLKYVLLLNLLIIADQNLHQKSFSHQNPLYIPFLLQGICP